MLQVHRTRAQRRSWLRPVALALAALFVVATGTPWVALASSGISDFACVYRPADEPDQCTITSVRAGGEAEAAGLRVGDEVLAVNGKPVQTYLEDDVPRRAGDRIALTVRRAAVLGQAGDGVEDVSIILQPLFTLALAPGSPAPAQFRSFLLFLLGQSLAGVLYIGIAVAVALARPDVLAARLLLLSCGSFAFVLTGQVAISTLRLSWWPETAPARWLLQATASAVQAGFLVLWLPALVHLFLAFPVPQPLLMKLRWLGPMRLRRWGGLTCLLYAVPLAVMLLGIAWQAAVTGDLQPVVAINLSYHDLIHTFAPSRPTGFVGLAAVLQPATLLGALWALIRSYRHAPTPWPARRSSGFCGRSGY